MGDVTFLQPLPVKSLDTPFELNVVVVVVFIFHNIDNAVFYRKLNMNRHGIMLKKI